LVKKTKKDSCFCMCCPNKGHLIAKGLISLALGLSLWMTYLYLEEVVAIILVLMGIKKIYSANLYSC